MVIATDSLLKEKLETIERRYEEVEALLSQPETVQDSSRLLALARERASLETTVVRYREYKATLSALEKTWTLQKEGLEPEMSALVKEELAQLQERQARLLEVLKKALFPPDPRDEKDVIMEVRAGTGGEEAALFAADLYRMYARYAQAKGWQAEVIDTSPCESGGV